MERIKEKRTGWILITSLFFLLPLFFNNSADGYYSNGGGYYDPSLGTYIPPGDPNYDPNYDPLLATTPASGTTATPSDQNLYYGETDDATITAVQNAARRNGITINTDTGGDRVVHIKDSASAQTLTNDEQGKISTFDGTLKGALTKGGITQQSVPEFKTNDVLIVDDSGDIVVFRTIDKRLELIYAHIYRKTEDGTSELVRMINPDSYTATTREGKSLQVQYGSDKNISSVITITTQKDELFADNGEKTWKCESIIGYRQFDGDGKNTIAGLLKDYPTADHLDLFYDPATGTQLEGTMKIYDAAGNLLNTPATTNPATPSDLSLRGRRGGNPSGPGTSSNPDAIPSTVNQVKKQLQEFSVAKIETVIDLAEAAGNISKEQAQKCRAIDETYLEEHRVEIQKSKLSGYGLSKDQISGYQSALDAGGEAAAKDYLNGLVESGLLTSDQVDGVFNLTIADGQEFYFLSILSDINFTEEQVRKMFKLPLEDFLTDIMKYSEWTVDYIMRANLDKTSKVMVVITQAASAIDFDKTLKSKAGNNFEELQAQAAQKIKESVLNGLIIPSSSVVEVSDILRSILEGLGI